MTHPLNEGSFEFVVAVASLHHLPLEPALIRFRSLLKSGGVLAIVGLYRSHTLEDYAWAAAGVPTSFILRCVRGQADVAAPVQNPKETFTEIRRASEDLLPGSVLRRRLLFRYSLTWRKP